MILNEIEDPRDWLARLKRRELVELAHAQGHTDITEKMAADDYEDFGGRVIPGIRTILRQRGVRPVPVPNRPLGMDGRHETRPMFQNSKPAAPAAAPDEWSEFQKWKASQPQAKPGKPERPKRLVERPKSEINRLRDECKRLGIKMDRRDRMADLKAKIEAHGQQNAPQQRQ